MKRLLFVALFALLTACGSITQQAQTRTKFGCRGYMVYARTSNNGIGTVYGYFPTYQGAVDYIMGDASGRDPLAPDNVTLGIKETFIVNPSSVTQCQPGLQDTRSFTVKLFEVN